MSISPYPHGLRVFFRTAMPDGSLHFTNLLTARAIVIETDIEEFVTALDEAGRILGHFNIVAVSMILPLDPPTLVEPPLQ